jgi:hypothetical protein
MEINKNKFLNILDDNYVFVKISPPQRAGIFPSSLQFLKSQGSSRWQLGTALGDKV